MDLAVKDAHLVAQHEQLDVLVASTTLRRDQERQQHGTPHVDEREHDP